MNEVFVKLANMSVAAGWLILAVLVLRLLLKKAPRWITCLLWALVAVRLVCPVSLQSPVSAYQVATPAAVQDSGGVTYFQYIHTSGDKPSIQLDVETIRPAGITPVQQDTAADTSHTVTRYMPPYVIIWLAVGGALLLYGLVSTLRLRYRVREGMRLRENIWLCDAVTSPFLLGILRPRIYLPSGMDERQMDYVLAHEHAHLRRGDHIWKPLGYLLLAVHWFNPLVWVAYWLFCRDIETACDERVVRSMGVEDKKAYSMALLTCSQGRRMVLACPVAFGEVGVKSRIKAVLHYKKPGFWIVLAAVLACIVVAVCFLTDPMGVRGQVTYGPQDADRRQTEISLSLDDAALDMVIYNDWWDSGQCISTRQLTATRYDSSLTIRMEEQEQMAGITTVLEADGGNAAERMGHELYGPPQEMRFVTCDEGTRRSVQAGDQVILAVLACDYGKGIPSLDCRTLERQPELLEQLDYAIVLRAEFVESDLTSREEIVGQDTDSAHEYLLTSMKWPIAVEIEGIDDPGSVTQDFDSFIKNNKWVVHPVEDTAAPELQSPYIVLHGLYGDALYIDSSVDYTMLWVRQEYGASAYSGDMTGREMVEALSGWAWRIKKGISRSKELVPDAETFFTRFVNGDFRGDIYGAQEVDGGDQMPFFTLMGMLKDYVNSHALTEEQYRVLMLNTDGLDGAYSSGYSYVLEQAYRRDPEAYLRVWSTLTYDQQKAIPWGEEDILPRPAELRWSADQNAMTYPYMTVNGGGTVFYMEISDELAGRIAQRVEENVKLGGFEPPQFTNGWGSADHSWTAERAEVFVRLYDGGSYGVYRGDGGVWGLSAEGNMVQADAEVQELLGLIAQLTGWQTINGRGAFSDLTKAELIYNDRVLHTVTDSDHLRQLQNLLQNGMQDTFAAKTPMERVQLRMTRSDGSQVSVLVDPDTPRIFLPPFYYYRYNDYESTGSLPLLEALGLTEWPAEVANEDCGPWLTALLNELVPLPGADSAG